MRERRGTSAGVRRVGGVPRQGDENGVWGMETGAKRKQNGNTKREKWKWAKVGTDAEGKTKTNMRQAVRLSLSKFDRKNLFLCRHVEAISDLLFSSVRLSALAIMQLFRVRQRSRLLELVVRFSR